MPHLYTVYSNRQKLAAASVTAARVSTTGVPYDFDGVDIRPAATSSSVDSDTDGICFVIYGF